jgi:hypothetical protein
MSSEATRDGLVEHVQCHDCGQTFPAYLFVADTDMATSGWVAFTGTRDKDIVLARCSPDCPWDGVAGPDYKRVKVAFDAHAVAGERAGFQHFLADYTPPKATYECIYCGGRAFGTRTESRRDFMVHGTLATRDDP